LKNFNSLKSEDSWRINITLYLGQALVLISERENNGYHLLAYNTFSIFFKVSLCFTLKMNPEFTRNFQLE